MSGCRRPGTKAFVEGGSIRVLWLMDGERRSRGRLTKSFRRRRCGCRGWRRLWSRGCPVPVRRRFSLQAVAAVRRRNRRRLARWMRVVEGGALGKAAEICRPWPEWIRPSNRAQKFVVGAEGRRCQPAVGGAVCRRWASSSVIVGRRRVPGQLLALVYSGRRRVRPRCFVAGVAERLAAQLGQTLVGNGAKA